MRWFSHFTTPCCSALRASADPVEKGTDRAAGSTALEAAAETGFGACRPSPNNIPRKHNIPILLDLGTLGSILAFRRAAWKMTRVTAVSNQLLRRDPLKSAREGTARISLRKPGPVAILSIAIKHCWSKPPRDVDTPQGSVHYAEGKW